MRVLIMVFLAACAVGNCFPVASAIKVKGGAFPPMWPLPKQYTFGSKSVTVSPHVKIVNSCVETPELLAAITRFKLNAFDHFTSLPDGAAGDVAHLDICMKSGTAPLQLSVDESYSLYVNATKINLNCGTQFGCYHGLETLSQLVSFDAGAGVYNIANVPWEINDAPRFPHRGLLIDTSRHFLPLRTIRAALDGMAYTKMNTLHWHIVDAVSFPFSSPSHPKLAEKGAFSKNERYTTADVASIVEYAKGLGIRVMVEFDVPGHSGAMCFGEPNICPQPACKSPSLNKWALDITKNYTYEVVNNVMKDMTHLFFDDFLHLGGDEVSYGCWQDTPYIMEWLAHRGLNAEGGYLYFTKRAHAMAHALGKTVVGWQELWSHFGTSLDPKTIIHQWLPNSVALPLNVTRHGYRLLWSDSSVWYLHRLEKTWQEIYNAEPCNGLPDANCGLVLGGEGCMWGEYADASDHLQTVFPRLAAVAERLWSPRATAVIGDNTEARLIALRCLLNERGIPAAPVLNAVARNAPPGPGSCYRQ